VSSSKGTWVTVEMRKVVSQWFRHPDDNLGLVIHSYDNQGRELAVIEATDGNNYSLVIK